MTPELIDQEVLIWIHVPEFDGGTMTFDDALKLAKERDQAAALQIQEDTLKLESLQRAFEIAKEEDEQRNRKISKLLGELGF